jgi:hypothetical protein
MRAGLAAHIPGVFTIEANSRQYVPSANASCKDKFPSISGSETEDLELTD